MMQISNLLKKHQLPDIKAIDDNGNTVLHLAVMNEKFTPQGKIKILEILLDKGLDPNIKNKNGETVLHLATVSREKSVIEFLMTRGMKLDYLLADYVIKNENDKYIKLTYQLKSNRMLQKVESETANFIEWIVSKGLDIDGKRRSGRSTLHLAIELNLQHILPVLLKYTNEVDYVDPQTKDTLLVMFLEYSGSKRYTYIARGLTWHIRDTSTKSNETLYPNYIQRYAKKIVEIMLDRGVPLDNIDADGNTALRVAIYEKANISIVEMLIERSADANRKNIYGETPLFTAIHQWLRSEDLKTEYYDKISRALIAKGADVDEPNERGMSLICMAVEAHNPEVVEFLQEHGTDLKIIVEHTQTLLHVFHQSSVHFIGSVNETRQIKLFDMLISSGCDVNAKDVDEETALHVAAIKNNSIFVQKLIESGSQVNVKDKNNQTPLHSAVCGNRIINVQKLIEHGAEVDARNNLNHTPLHLTTLGEDGDIAQLLLEHGANVNAKDSKGFTVLCMANSDDMIQLLLKHGAEFDALLDKKRLVIRENLWPDYDEDTDEDMDDDTDEDYEKALLFKHWIKLDVAKLKCFTLFEYRKLMKKYEDHFSNCLKEIETLKNTYIDSRTSLYTLLHMNLNSRRAYIHNEKLQNIVKSPMLEEQFPEYSVLIFSSYREAVTRKSLMDPAKIAWLQLTKIRLPEICIELIFSFLRNSDLYEIIGRN